MYRPCVFGQKIGTKFFLNVLLAMACIASTQRMLAATAAPFKLIHSFAGGANDGAMPTFSTPLVVGSTVYGVAQGGGASTNGVLFKMSSTGSGYSVLHHFNGYTLFLNPGGSKSDGALPTGMPVLLGSTLYGMTTWGGSNGLGTIYKINTDGSAFQVLHHFANTGNDGYFPQGSLLLEGSTLFGMTASGGSNFSQGVVFRIETSGEGYQLLHHFTPGSNDGAAALGSLALSGNTLYGMTQLGGNLNNGVLFALNTNGGGYHIVHTFTGTISDGGLPYGSPIVDGTNIYGMTGNGGANNVGIVFKIGTGGNAFQILHSFALNEGWQPFGEVTLVGSTLYGMTHNGGPNGLGAGTLFQLNTDGSGYQTLHTFVISFDGKNGWVPFASLSYANSVLYGMTSQGGVQYQGSVFSYNLGGGTGGDGTAELSGSFDSMKEACKTKHDVLGCTLAAALTVQNTGTGTSDPINLRYFLSADAAFDAGIDVQLSSKKLAKIKAGKSKKLRLKAKTTESTANKYLLAVDDSGKVLAATLIELQ